MRAPKSYSTSSTSSRPSPPTVNPMAWVDASFRVMPDGGPLSIATPERASRLPTKTGLRKSCILTFLELLLTILVRPMPRAISSLLICVLLLPIFRAA